MVMSRKTVLALFTVAAVGLLSPTVASARGGFGGGGFHGGGFHGGGFHGGGFHGFHGGRGFAFGAGLGLYAPYAYGAYGYPYGYYGDYSDYYDDDDGGCYVVQRRVHTRYGWRLRPVEVCN
jgi:hypothetical protein